MNSLSKAVGGHIRNIFLLNTMLFLVHYIHSKILICLRGIRLYKPDLKNEYAFNHFLLPNTQHSTTKSYQFQFQVNYFNKTCVSRTESIYFFEVNVITRKPEGLIARRRRE